MDCRTDAQLKSMMQSLQQQLNVANELRLDFAAQLLSMTLMEITTKMHGISAQELDALCECIEGGSPGEAKQGEPVMGLRNYDRRSRSRRGRG